LEEEDEGEEKLKVLLGEELSWEHKVRADVIVHHAKQGWEHAMELTEPVDWTGTALRALSRTLSSMPMFSSSCTSSEVRL
jgi:predicted secreted protein